MSAEKKTILVVDDESIIRDFLTEVLDDYDVSVACDGDDAIELLKSQRYDLIITDLRMPRIPGEQVVKVARETYPDQKVIVMSGYSSLYTASQSVSSGACSFLSKPFSIKQLMQAVEKAMSESGG